MDGAMPMEPEIVANSRREAAKLYGLVLKHNLKHLGGIPCRFQVVQKGNDNDHPDQCFKLWKVGNKVYVECFVTPKRVSSNILVTDDHGDS